MLFQWFCCKWWFTAFFFYDSYQKLSDFLFSSEIGETSLLETQACREQPNIWFESFATATASISVVLIQPCFISCCGHQVTFCMCELFNCLYSLYFFSFISEVRFMYSSLKEDGEEVLVLRLGWFHLTCGSSAVLTALQDVAGTAVSHYKVPFPKLPLFLTCKC